MHRTKTENIAGVHCYSYVIVINVPYSLKFSRVKIFVDFGVPVKILALKVLSYSINQCSTSAIWEIFIYETAKFTIPRKF